MNDVFKPMYAIMILRKIHTTQQIDYLERHCTTLRSCLKNRTRPENEEKNIFKVTKAYGDGLTASQALKKKYENELTIRPKKNSVLGYEIVFSYSPEADEFIQKDFNTWRNDCVQWAISYFGHNPIAYAEHHDEHTDHIHLIMPCSVVKEYTNEDGERVSDCYLNAKYFTGGKLKLVEMQNSYAEAIQRDFPQLARGKSFLEHPERTKKRRHKDHKKYWAEKNREAEIQEYNARTEAEYKKTESRLAPDRQY